MHIIYAYNGGLDEVTFHHEGYQHRIPSFHPLLLGPSIKLPAPGYLATWLRYAVTAMGSVGWESVVSNALGSATAGMLSRLVTHPLGAC
jgi:hypothetical protein